MTSIGVVGDRLERDVRDALVDEALPHVAVCRRVRWRLARDLGFLALTLRAVGEEVVRLARAHDPGAGKCQRYSGGVDGNPAAAPLLGDVGGGAGPAGRVEHQIPGVGSHEDAALDYNRRRFYDIRFVPAETTRLCVLPYIS